MFLLNPWLISWTAGSPWEELGLAGSRRGRTCTKASEIHEQHFPWRAHGQTGEFSPESTKFIPKAEPQSSVPSHCCAEPDLAEPAGCLGWEIAVSVHNWSIVRWERQIIELLFWKSWLFLGQPNSTQSSLAKPSRALGLMEKSRPNSGELLNLCPCWGEGSKQNRKAEFPEDSVWWSSDAWRWSQQHFLNVLLKLRIPAQLKILQRQSLAIKSFCQSWF